MSKDKNEKGALRRSSFHGEILGRTTDIICSSFTDQNFIVVTQYQKIGTLVSVTTIENAPRNVSQEPTFDTKVLFGADSDSFHIFAKAIANVVHKVSAASKSSHVKTHNPLLCSITLADNSRETLQEICKELEKIWPLVSPV